MPKLNSFAQVIHHGGKQTVTGSCHELQLPQGSLLIDCGLFQGQELKQQGSLAINFSLKKVQALVLTHAHIDHIGRLPWLIAAGFQGPIYCTKATAALVPLMLADGLKLQTTLNPQQREQVLALIKKRLIGCNYNHWQRVGELCDVRFQPAGHILGSAYVECKLRNEEVVVFSGDLGPFDTPLLPDPTSPERADYLLLESTYGDKQHESIANRKQRLLQICQHALEDGGVIVIPAFSVGRTQELLFDLEQILYEQQLTADLPIVLDSPLANQVTDTYREFKQLWSNEAKVKLAHYRHPLAFEQCIQIDDHHQHLALVNRLANNNESAIVIAASGMCEGGRVVNYLKALLPDKRNDVLFAGYQAKATLGNKLQSGLTRVEIDQEMVDVNAQIHTMSGYSAHADQADLLKFVQGIQTAPKEVHLIHGEAHTQQAFSRQLSEQNYNVVV